MWGEEPYHEEITLLIIIPKYLLYIISIYKSLSEILILDLFKQSWFRMSERVREMDSIIVWQFTCGTSTIHDQLMRSQTVIHNGTSNT